MQCESGLASGCHQDNHNYSRQGCFRKVASPCITMQQTRCSDALKWALNVQVLLRRLQVEAARAAATPAQRLLDDALQILAGTVQMEYQARKQVR